MSLNVWLCSAIFKYATTTYTEVRYVFVNTAFNDIEKKTLVVIRFVTDLTQKYVGLIKPKEGCYRFYQHAIFLCKVSNKRNNCLFCPRHFI